MNKPKEGDVLLIKSMPGINEGAQEVKVLAVFDDYEPFELGGPNDWGNDGELSWAQRDIDETARQKGEWYAIVFNPEVEHETWSVGSYEVEEVKAS